MESENKYITFNYLNLKTLQKLIDEHFRAEKFPSECADLMFYEHQAPEQDLPGYIKQNYDLADFNRIVVEAKECLSIQMLRFPL